MGDTPNNTYFGIVAPGDIVARLHDALEVTYEGWPLLSDAAAEIERLRHQVDDLRRCLEDEWFVIKQLRAIAEFAAHSDGCEQPWHGIKRVCTCGLMELLEARQ